MLCFGCCVLQIGHIEDVVVSGEYRGKNLGYKSQQTQHTLTARTQPNVPAHALSIVAAQHLSAVSIELYLTDPTSQCCCHVCAGSLLICLK